VVSPAIDGHGASALSGFSAMKDALYNLYRLCGRANNEGRSRDLNAFVQVARSAAGLVLPSIVALFQAACPGIRLEVIADETFNGVLAAGCDAGIRYEERLDQDMIAVPIGPRIQRSPPRPGAAACFR
jgi:DNA-binding transcriptional LysR family regulator